MAQDAVHINLNGGRSYAIHFAPFRAVPRLLTAAGLRKGSCLIVTDTNVAGHYLEKLRGYLLTAGWSPLPGLILPAGERSKAPELLHQIYDHALKAGIDRQTPVLALGEASSGIWPAMQRQPCFVACRSCTCQHRLSPKSIVQSGERLVSIIPWVRT